MTDRSVNPAIARSGTIVLASGKKIKEAGDIRARRRRQIIDAAMKEFARNGYHDTEVAKIASRAGVAKGTIYNYFEDKEDILLAVITSGFDSLGRRMRRIADSDKDPLTKISRAIKEYLDFLDKPEDFRELLLKESVHILPRARSGYRDHIELHVTELGKLIKEAQRLGQIKKVDTRFAALCLIGLVEAVTKGSIAMGRKHRPVADHRDIMKLFLNGIGKQ